MNKVIVLLIFAVVIVSAGCGEERSANEPIIFIMDMCYVNSEYLSTGNEEVPAVLYFENEHFYALEGKQYFMLLDTVLRENPLGLNGVDTMITDKIQFNSVEVVEGTAFVDIKGEGLSGSSLEEGLLISQIVNSLMGSFDEVHRVRFLVDGETAETLMGHYDAENPYEEGIYTVWKDM